MPRRFRVLFVPFVAFVAFLAPAGTARATSIMGRLGEVGRAAGFQAESTTFSGYIGSIITIAMSLLGVIFVAQMVYAGYLWMTARDEADQVDKAKHIIRRSIIGLAIVLAAWAITSFVLSRLYGAAGAGETVG